MTYQTSDPMPPVDYASAGTHSHRTRWAVLLTLWLIVFLVVWLSFGSSDLSSPTTADAQATPRLTVTRGDLNSDEQVTINIFEQASPAVVFITNIAYQRISPFSFNVSKVPAGSGSGFIYDRNGHIVTNMHVVYGARELAVTLADRMTYAATMVGSDADKDLAVLKIEVPAAKLTPILLGTSGDLKVGQNVYAIGNPFGWDHTLTTGVISALGREIDSLVEGRTIRDVIQTDAAINPGNSGGPLLDSAGALIGVNTQIASPSGASAGIGFAIPVDTVNRVVSQIIKYGRVIRPGFGVSLVPDHIARALELKGVLLDTVPANSAAAASGLRGTIVDRGGVRQLGDVIMAIDQDDVVSRNDLLNVLEQHKVGDKVTVSYIRDGRRHKATVTLQRVN